jgi:hypothetical protein
LAGHVCWWTGTSRPDLPTSPPPVSHDDETEESAHVDISLVENSAENHDAFAHPNSDFSTVSSHVDLPYFLQQDQRFKAYKAVQENPGTPTWRQALASAEAEQWMKEAERELNSLLKNDSIIIVKKTDCSPKLTPLPTMMICRRKRNESNEVVLHKCRMVAGGHRQVEGVHYDPSELYAPTASQLTVKLVFANMRCSDGI